MGGHAAGEVASALTVKAIVESVDSDNGAASTDAALRVAFARAQRTVSTHSFNTAGHRGMGSTAVAAAVEGELLHICHVGDARAYHFSGRRIRRLTTDHSWVWELVKARVLTPEQARFHPHRGRLMQAIGGSSGIKPDLTSVELKSGDRVLLCSDGLWESLSDEEILVTAACVDSPRRLATALVDKANAAGGNDNITAIVYRHGA
jgi:protein phosphatase